MSSPMDDMNEALKHDGWRAGEGWQGFQYNYPVFKWWQPLKKWRWRKKMSKFSPGQRIKFSPHGITFSDDITIMADLKTPEGRELYRKDKKL